MGSSGGPFFLPRKGEKKIRRLGRFGGRLEDCTRVLVQDPEPASDVFGVIWPWFVVEPEVTAEKRRRQLSNELFERICLRPEAPGEVTRQSLVMAAPVCRFVEQRCIVSVGGLEVPELGDLQEVPAGVVVCPVSAKAEIQPRDRCDESLGIWYAVRRRRDPLRRRV